MTDSDPFARWPDRTPTYDADGTLLFVATIATATRTGGLWADGVWRPASTPASDTADALLGAFAGALVSTDDTELVGLLTLAGAVERRHAHVMSHDLRSIPPMPSTADLIVETLAGVRLDELAPSLGAVNLAAYSADHPDHEHTDPAKAVEELRAIGRGELLGPYLEQVSTIAWSDGAPVGACLIVDRDGVAPDGGPWIIDVFRDPGTPIKAVGASLLVGALEAARDTGQPSVSLAVTHANGGARSAYARLGFVDAGESWTLALPTS